MVGEMREVCLRCGAPWDSLGKDAAGSYCDRCQDDVRGPCRVSTLLRPAARTEAKQEEKS